MSHHIITGVATTHMQADTIISALKSAGIPASDISVITSHQAQAHMSVPQHHQTQVADMAAGASAGAVAGAVLPVLISLGLVVVPGLGMIVATGPILAALSGAGLGAGIGSLAGALVGAGVHPEEASHFERWLQRGNLIISVHPRSPEHAVATRTVFSMQRAKHVTEL